MRASPTLLCLAAATAVLAGCSKPASAPDQAATPTEPASAPAPAAPTPEQIKASLAALPAPYSAGDVENGKMKFTQCAACHTTGEGGPNMTGPNLYGVFGRKAGTAANFSYSDGLKAAGWTWDAAHIDTWITNPKAMIDGTRMAFAGVKDAKDRADVIAYLKVATSAPGK